MRRRHLLLASLLLTFPVCGEPRAQMPASQGAQPGATAVVLTREQAAAILPATVFFRGQSAAIQARNSSGLKLPDGRLVLFALVDSAGYASALQQTYQAYLITEVPLTIGGQSLAPGAYGFGFVADRGLVLMDIGGNELLHAPTATDSRMPRPTPLQLIADAGPAAQFRLYLGRKFVTVAPSVK